MNDMSKNDYDAQAAALACARREIDRLLDLVSMQREAIGQLMANGNAGRAIGVDWGLVNDALTTAVEKLASAEGWHA